MATPYNFEPGKCHQFCKMAKQKMPTRYNVISVKCQHKKCQIPKMSNL